ncbi:hypothetical protein [Intrasporangium sp. YIM S08009]|uniref:hypothetical protein n=1 Tax=Intrasporangium zincisolvens TaxID=3080018 RepID=UPI002B055686|nr:hypothetical protein [Intrasporangium sp. YIM S08009]
MTWLSVVLVGLGVADLVRSSSWRRSRLVAHVAAPVVIAALAWVAGLTSWPDVLALALAAVVSAVWMELSRHAQRTGRRALEALAAFAVVVVGLILFSGAASTPGGALATWLHWADLPGGASHSPARVLLIAGLVAFNVATANVIVRLILLTIGALRPDQVAAPPVPDPADRLKGGRLLGPMERLVILGLGLAGELGAAGFVIAAKGLLRFPEVQAAARGGSRTGPGSYSGGPAGIDDVTEYFLVGSFVSWILALTTLALGH